MSNLIPESALRRHMAILGINGAGKSSADKGQIIEPALAAGERCCIIDPKGEAWGLRLGRDGKAAGGLHIYIVGGDHADFPLNKRDGAMWAEIVGTSSDSFAFDTSLMTVSDRSFWFTEFAEALLRKNRGPLNLTIDEVHLFAPQAGASSGGLAPAMLHATNNLLALGRSKGLRVRMVSQRPAKVHKDALTQAHTLIAMMMVAPQDRKAVSEWISDQAEVEKGKEIIASLPTLAVGEAWVWAPAEKMLERVRFPMPKTYDSSKAPDSPFEAIKLTPIDPAKISERLAKVAEDAKASNPATLRAEIATLRRQMAEATSAASKSGGTPDPHAIEAAERRGFERGEAEGSDRIMRAVAGLAGNLSDSVGRAEAACADARRLLESFAGFIGTQADEVRSRRAVAPPPTPARAPMPRMVAGEQPHPGDDANLSGPQRQLLTALDWWRAMGHDAPTRTQLAAKAGWKPKGSNLRNRLSELSSRRLVTYPSDGRVALTPAGAAVAPAADTGETLVESIRVVLTGPQLAVFDTLWDFRGDAMTRVAIAAHIGWEPNGSNLRNRLSELSSLELVEYPAKGEVALQAWVIG